MDTASLNVPGNDRIGQTGGRGVQVMVSALFVVLLTSVFFALNPAFLSVQAVPRNGIHDKAVKLSPWLQAARNSYDQITTDLKMARSISRELLGCYFVPIRLLGLTWIRCKLNY